MTRTIVGGLATHLATGVTELSRCIRLDLRDGTVLGITDHDEDLSVSLGDSPDNDLYRADVGAASSDMTLSVGFESDTCEIRGPLGEVVTRAAVLGGRYDRARARIFDVRRSDTTQIIRLMSGKVAAARIEGGAFVLEVRSAIDAYNQTIGRVYGPMCTHDLGDAKCTVVPTTFAAEVSAVDGDLSFDVTWTGGTPSADDLVNGLVSFDTGALAGTLPIEIFSVSGATITLYTPMAEPPQVGDELTVTEGCDKTRPTCRDRFANMLNFGGWPDNPGTANTFKYAVPGQGNGDES